MVTPESNLRAHCICMSLGWHTRNQREKYSKRCATSSIKGSLNWTALPEGAPAKEGLVALEALETAAV